MQNEIHYFSIVNSLLITLFLTGVVAMIMLRTLRKDISSYNEVRFIVPFHALYDYFALFRFFYAILLSHLMRLCRMFCANAEKGAGVFCVAEPRAT